jgi:hypothetical protein
MDEGFSQWVATDAWRAEAVGWIGERLAESGHQVTGEVEQPRIRPWSTQLVVPTDRGTVWFKANCPAMAFEPALLALLAELEPAEVDEPLAVDTRRGWMLTADRGPTLGEQQVATTGQWRSVVRLAAQLQHRLVGHEADILATGVPDCSPGSVPARYDAMLTTLSGLPADHPSHLGAAERARLTALRPRVAEAVDRLLATPVPPSLQHGDLHARNVFATADGLRIFDFGDAQWTHPFEVLAVPRNVVHDSGLPWTDVVDAYLQTWSDVDPSVVTVLLDAAMLTHAVNRAQTWLDCMVGAQPHEQQEWGGAALAWLQAAFEPFPPSA